jgi:hypothetical protein
MGTKFGNTPSRTLITCQSGGAIVGVSVSEPPPACPRIGPCVRARGAGRRGARGGRAAAPQRGALSGRTAAAGPNNLAETTGLFKSKAFSVCRSRKFMNSSS